MHRTESTAPVSAPSTRLVNPASLHPPPSFSFCLLFALELTLLIPVSSTYVKHAKGERESHCSKRSFLRLDWMSFLTAHLCFVCFPWIIEICLGLFLRPVGCRWLQLLQMFAHVLSPWNFTEPYVISCKVSKGRSVQAAVLTATRTIYMSGRQYNRWKYN